MTPKLPVPDFLTGQSDLKVVFPRGYLTSPKAHSLTISLIQRNRFGCSYAENDKVKALVVW
jgi:hypothetical protein